MSRLRAYFLAPASLVNFICFLIPMAIVLAYSLLSRGVYGGVELPWTFESYLRLADPLYGGILLRSFTISVVSTLLGELSPHAVDRRKVASNAPNSPTLVRLQLFKRRLRESVRAVRLPAPAPFSFIDAFGQSP